MKSLDNMCVFMHMHILIFWNYKQFIDDENKKKLN